MKKHFPVLLYIFSIGFLVFGVTKPLMTIKVNIEKQEVVEIATKTFFSSEQSNNLIRTMLQPILQQIKVEGNFKVFESSRSLLEMMAELITRDHIIIGLLIGLFGIVIPLIKIILNLLVLLLNSPEDKSRLLKISDLLSKWSMSDVFFIAILVSFMSVNANEQAINSVQMSAEPGPGFYFFTTYCLLSIIASQLMSIRGNKLKVDFNK